MINNFMRLILVKNKIFLTMLVLIGLVGLGSSAFDQVQTNAGSISNATGQIQTTASSIKLAEGAVDLKVPISLINNSSKAFWKSPSKIPATITASVINNGKINLDVGAVSLNSTTKKQEYVYAGRVMPGGDGLIIFGKYIELVITCQNSTTKQYGSGTLEVVTLVP
jgi:hypothetical protein